MEADRARHYQVRSTSERCNSDLKGNIRVRGAAKVGLYLMFGIVVMSAEALLRLVV
ncbi:MAG: hypothetical protein KDK99_13275 [Verrucomicrobiales bacterium]|nr:hypothetical protein [Verrucomicrobiales bacterium]